MRKAILSLALALVLCLSLAVPAFAAGEFRDVPSDAYYADAVAWAVKQEITAGTSAATFSPENVCTRGQIITFLWRAAGSPRASTGGVKDITEGDFFYQAVLWAKDKGMFDGDVFQPNVPCTRLMAVEFMWKSATSSHVEGNPFSDVQSDAVNWAMARGITEGTSASTFSPSLSCTRGQIVTFLYRDKTFNCGGSYLREDGKARLELGDPKSEMKYAFYITEKVFEGEPDSNVPSSLFTTPQVYGTLNSNPYRLGWVGIVITLYKDYVEVEFSGDLKDKQSSLGGKYIRQSSEIPDISITR